MCVCIAQGPQNKYSSKGRIGFTAMYKKRTCIFCVCNCNRVKKIAQKLFYNYATLLKKKLNFLHIGNSEGSVAKLYMTNDVLIYRENICAFLRSPASYMTCHPIPSEFPYI